MNGQQPYGTVDGSEIWLYPIIYRVSDISGGGNSNIFGISPRNTGGMI